VTSEQPPARAPREVYESRLAARQAASSEHARLERRLSNARLLVFALGAAAAFAAYGRERIPGWAPLPLAAAFAVLVISHDRVIRNREHLDRAAAFYAAGLDRLEDKVESQGETGERFLDPGHLFAADLDVFGTGSLFQLLCRARTRAGQETLAAWLLAPAAPDEVRARQQAVAELAPRLDAREELVLLAGDASAGLHPEALLAWAEAPPSLPGRHSRLAAGALASATLASIAVWLVTPSGAPLFAFALAAQTGFAALLRARVTRIARKVESAARDLRLFSATLEWVERQPFASPRLAALRAALDSAGQPPSQRIARLARLVELLDARRNQLFAPFGALVLWTTQLAFALEAWRRASGPAVRRWIEVVGEVEALASLASHAYEHPDDPFPELVDAGPRFEARGLGHPLLPEASCVRNDVALGAQSQLWVVSGSNMSGKSTLLRSVGVAALLAQAGAPVRARGLVLSPLAIGASIRVQDSLREGSSRFYAEIRRLRDVVDRASGDPPLLFLLDEILGGTNSHDRRIGAEALVRELARRGAIGLVTTHDLALAEIPGSLAPARNVHFEDQLAEGRIHFDYRLRDGVVTRSNALELMRAVGLPV
jgi:hypothetical protein